LVSINQQWLWAYQNRRLLYDTPVTTGRPELPTPDGIYHVQYKLQNVEFYSAWPPGSPYYYAPEHVDFALYFLDVGYYIHSATWRYQFGPGTEVPHTDSNGKQETGSHGCVEVPYNAGAWLYQWAYDGATVDITGTTPAPVATPTPTTAPVNTPTPTPTSLPPTPTALPPTETPTP
jgi:lipoprotein-anchoring transpeptidase ErfK/SrfK